MIVQYMVNGIRVSWGVVGWYRGFSVVAAGHIMRSNNILSLSQNSVQNKYFYDIGESIPTRITIRLSIPSQLNLTAVAMPA